jgi:hypothetical protein
MMRLRKDDPSRATPIESLLSKTHAIIADPHDYPETA